MIKHCNIIPAREVLTCAMETNKRLGHENLGFLSESHGIMPINAPCLKLPPTYAIWDQIALELPFLSQSLRIRTRLNKLPILRANDSIQLADKFLLRASVIISAFAHAYYYIDPQPLIGNLPAAIQVPWDDIALRLQRKKSHMSYIDMSTYNWRLIDKTEPNPMKVENLALLVPIWGNEAERVFLASTIETQAQSTPLITAIVRAQEAVVADNPEKLAIELKIIIKCLHHLTHVCLPKISPNRYSPFFVEPVAWTKTFAPLSVPLQKGAAGPVGAATASLQALDAFIERKKYEGDVGYESQLVCEWYPPHWRNFYLAVQKISVLTYIKAQKEPILISLFQEILEAYAGETGYLGRHRLKVYGYIETAFKTGRKATAAFEGSFKDRIWDKIDDGLLFAQKQRYHDYTPSHYYHLAKVQCVEAVSLRGNVVKIELEINANGIQYKPGDRCGILPENNDDLIQKNLRALKAKGDEMITLNPAWQLAIQYRDGYQNVKKLSLATFLKFAQLRPLTRTATKLLYQLSSHPLLLNIIHQHTEHNWELWELLNILAEDGFESKKILIENTTDTYSLINQLFPSETFRYYSISSWYALTEKQFKLQLIVGRLEYKTKSTPNEREQIRQGVGSHFLASKPSHKISVKLIPSPHFRLPKAVTRPIIMFAGGTGISPCLSFLQTRSACENSGENWLFFSIRSRDDFHCQNILEQLVAKGKLKLQIIFSREDSHAVFVKEKNTSKGCFQFIPGRRQSIEKTIINEKNAHIIWQALRPLKEGGSEASVYICGHTGFAKNVKQALQSIFESFYEGSQESQLFSRQYLEDLITKGRYQQETFSLPSAILNKAQGHYFSSEIVLHNNEHQGYWLVIDDIVYDITSFRYEHPGGFKILRSYSGLDATIPYRRVGHHHNMEIKAILAGYRIGHIITLKTTSVKSLYQDWLNYLYLIVEVENTLYNEYSVQQEAATCDETMENILLSPAKLMMYINSHQRFLDELLPQIFGKELQKVWVGTLEKNKNEHLDLPNIIYNCLQADIAKTAKMAHKKINLQLLELIKKDHSPKGVKIQDLYHYCLFFEREDHALLQQIKYTIRSIIQSFEQINDHDLNVIPYKEMSQRLQIILQTYHQRLAKTNEQDIDKLLIMQMQVKS